MLNIHYSTVFSYIKRYSMDTKKQGNKTFLKRAQVQEVARDKGIEPRQTREDGPLVNALFETLQEQLDVKDRQIANLQERNKELDKMLSDMQNQVRVLLHAMRTEKSGFWSRLFHNED